MANNKKVFTREEWEKKLSDVKIAKEDMNRLVMNYFVIEGCVEAVEKFQMESGTEPNMDFASIKNRVAVKKAVEDGKIKEAIEKLNSLNPEILATNLQLVFHLQQQRFIELIRNKKVEEALMFAKELGPIGVKSPGFLDELERTVTLLIFEDVNNCPLSELLEISQRQKTASEVNAAILRSQNQETDPLLPSMLKMLRLAQGELSKEAVYPLILNLSSAKFVDVLDWGGLADEGV